MLIYRWNSPSLVTSAEIEKRMDGYWGTLKFAHNGIDEDQLKILTDLPHIMASRGMHAYADTNEDGQHVLRITNIDRLKQLFSVLKENNLINAEKPQFSKTKTSLLRDDDNKPKGVWGFIKKYAQRLRGVSGQIGDVFLLFHLMEERRLVKSGELEQYVKEELELAGDNEQAREKILDDANTIHNGSSTNLWLLLSYASQSAIHTFFGAGKDEVKPDRIMEKVKKRVSSAGGELNDLAHLTQRQSNGSRNTAHRMFTWFRRNAVMVSEAIPLFGNWKKMRTGLTLNTKKERSYDPSKGFSPEIVNYGQFLTGLSHFIVNLIAVFIPEQTKESIEADPKSPWFKKNAIYQWIAARPIKIQSWVTMLDKPLFQIPDVISLAPKLKKRKSMHSLEIGFYTLGRVFGAAASKNSEKPNNLEAYTPVFTMAANLLTGLTEKKASNTINIMSEELAQEIQQEIGKKVDREEISTKIREKLKLLQDSPFLHAVSKDKPVTDTQHHTNSTKLEMRKSAPVTFGIEKSEASDDKWRDKHTASGAAVLTPALAM